MTDPRTGPYTCDAPETRVPRMYVERPGPGPSIQFGLFSAARIMENVERHALNGIEHEPVCNTEVYEWPHFCASYGLYGATDAERLEVGRPDPRCNPYPLPERWADDGYENPRFDGGPHSYWTRDADGNPLEVVNDTKFSPPYALKRVDPTKGLTWADPFTVYAGESCFTGNHDNDTAVRNLRERFDLGEQEAVERVIYSGFLPDPESLDWANRSYPDPVKPHLRPALRWDPQILNGGNRTPLPQAIGLLEHWMQADSGARGVIHAPAYMATTLTGKDILSASGPRSLTRLGHTFVFGTGYSGRKPKYTDGTLIPDRDKRFEQGATPAPAPEQMYDEAWLYITRPITVRRSAVIEPADWNTGAVNQRTNHGSMVIERIYVVDWPCSVAAIRTDFPLYGLEPGLASNPATGGVSAARPEDMDAVREHHTTAHIEEESSR